MCGSFIMKRFKRSTKTLASAYKKSAYSMLANGQWMIYMLPYLVY